MNIPKELTVRDRRYYELQIKSGVTGILYIQIISFNKVSID